MRKIFALALAALLALAAPVMAAQNTIPLMTGPLDPSSLLSYFNTLILSINSTYSVAPCTVAGSTPRTCNGNSGIATTDSLTTAALTNASYVINNSAVNATSVVTCSVDSYGGTINTNGIPIVTQCVPTAGVITVNIFNAQASNALAGAVGIAFRVYN